MAHCRAKVIQGIRFIAALNLVLAHAAFADPSAGAASPSPSANAPSAPSGQQIPTTPTPLDCAKFLPPGVTVPNQIDPTIFSFRVTTDGIMHPTAVVKSSGDDAMDRAVLTCADGYKIGTMELAGVPTELSWVRAYFWSPPWRTGYFWTVTTSGGTEMCDRRQYPHDDIRKGIEGSAKISFRISADGSVVNVQLLQSTGAADLDQISINCVSAWHFYPVKQNGKPVEIDKTVMIGWHLWMWMR